MNLYIWDRVCVQSRGGAEGAGEEENFKQTDSPWSVEPQFGSWSHKPKIVTWVKPRVRSSKQSQLTSDFRTWAAKPSRHPWRESTLRKKIWGVKIKGISPARKHFKIFIRGLKEVVNERGNLKKMVLHREHMEGKTDENLSISWFIYGHSANLGRRQGRSNIAILESRVSLSLSYF